MAEHCVRWYGATMNSGYGVAGRKLAHRAAWEEKNGPIPAGMVIMHSCDNRLCISLAHLRLGTQKQNIRDMHEKGRDRNGAVKGKAKHAGFGALQAAAQHGARLRTCECGMVTNAGAMARHAKKTGHSHGKA